MSNSSLSKPSDVILHLLSHLYAQRSFSLWKPKQRAEWFAKTVIAVTPSLSQKPTTTQESKSSPSLALFHDLYSTPSLASSIYRHVMVLESVSRAGRLFGFLPSHVTGARQLACDPLPPPTRVSQYDSEFDFSNTRGSLLCLQTLLYMLIQRAGTGTLPPPGFAAPSRSQLSAQWDAIPAPSTETVTLGDCDLIMGHDDLESDDLLLENEHDVANHVFGWDNESPKRVVHVKKFQVEWRPVTNGEFLAFWKKMDGKIAMPPSWVEEDGEIKVCMKPLMVRSTQLTLYDFRSEHCMAPSRWNMRSTGLVRLPTMTCSRMPNRKADASPPKPSCACS